MGYELSLVAMMRHVQDVAEKVVAAGRRPAGTCRLHGETAEDQALEKGAHGFGLACRNAFRVRKQGVEVVLQHMPGLGNNGLGPYQVRDYPLSSCRHLCGKVGITGGGHILRGGRQHGGIGQHGHRRGAVESLLGVLIGDGGSERSVTVHRSGRRNGKITLFMMM